MNVHVIVLVQAWYISISGTVLRFGRRWVDWCLYLSIYIDRYMNIYIYMNVHVIGLVPAWYISIYGTVLRFGRRWVDWCLYLSIYLYRYTNIYRYMNAHAAPQACVTSWRRVCCCPLWWRRDVTSPCPCVALWGPLMNMHVHVMGFVPARLLSGYPDGWIDTSIYRSIYLYIRICIWKHMLWDSSRPDICLGLTPFIDIDG